MKVLIIQARIPSYRIGIFESISHLEEVSRLDIMHVGNDVVEIPSARVIRMESYSFAGLTFVRGVIGLARKYDAVIAMFDIKWAFIYQLLGSIYCKRTLLWGHGNGRTRRYKWVDIFRQILAHRAAGLIFYDEKSRDEFCVTEKLRQKSFVANNSIINKVKLESRSFYDLKAFIFVGRLIPEKNISYIFDVLATTTGLRDFLFHIVGDGSQRKDLEAKCIRLKLESQVIFHGEIYDDRALSKLFGESFAYIAICPTGLGFVHSFSFGCPVITLHDISHGPEIEYCNSDNTIFLDSVENLGKKMLDLSRSQDLNSRMSIAARNTYQNEASPDRMIAGFRRAISDLNK